MSDKPTLPLGGNHEELQAQKHGILKRNKIDIPAAGSAAVPLFPAPDSRAFIGAAYVPETAPALLVFEDSAPSLIPGEPPCWKQAAGTRDVMDGVANALKTYFGVSAGVAFSMTTTEIG